MHVRRCLAAIFFTSMTFCWCRGARCFTAVWSVLELLFATYNFGRGGGPFTLNLQPPASLNLFKHTRRAKSSPSSHTACACHSSDAEAQELFVFLPNIYYAVLTPVCCLD
jgi:hypothetical protein